MSSTPPPQALPTDARTGPGEPPADEGAFAWLRALGPRGRRAFGGAFGGYALDSYDYFTLPLSMVALAAYFGLNSGQTGLFTTVSRLVSCTYFKMEKVRFTEGVEEAVPYDEPVVWIMLEGTAEVRVDGVKEPTRFTRGETVLLPAAMKNPVIKTLSDCVWLEVTFPTKAEVT